MFGGRERRREEDGGRERVKRRDTRKMCHISRILVNYEYGNTYEEWRRERRTRWIRSECGTEGRKTKIIIMLGEMYMRSVAWL